MQLILGRSFWLKIIRLNLSNNFANILLSHLVNCNFLVTILDSIFMLYFYLLGIIGLVVYIPYAKFPHMVFGQIVRVINRFNEYNG